ncbi:peptidase C1B, bleomycin hydrolase [Rickenella mellea]|uniref:Cysteine proteinase 1, mitochondrial n=1 Tax=Rickenella mellea TaxID=50990 RepID=A0A4Y7Q5M2_9AGAM|nr:peptidase C1B, bleomycin hydrolase [Rickenella mellea]
MGSNVSKPAPQPVEAVSEKFSSLSVAAAEPKSADGSLSSATVETWESEASRDPTTHLARTILSHTDFKIVLMSRDAKIADTHVFNTQLEFKADPITSQKSSGRCWLFATTNVLRHHIMKKLNLKEFELSQSYLFLWDKLNKCNYYLEQSIQLADRPLDDRVVSFLSSDLISDGGQWDMAVNLLETYGVVPQTVFPESYSSSYSSPMNGLLKLKLREHALILRRLAASLNFTPSSLDTTNANSSDDAALKTLRAKKEELMAEIWRIITATLGVPPLAHESFTWDYYDKDGKPHTWSGTPVEYYKAFSNKQYPAVDSFSLINDPRNEYSKLYTVDRLGNLWGGRPVLYVNTEIENLKNAIVKMIKAGQPVFFGCDVGQFSNTPSGIMDTALHQIEGAFNIKLGLTKAERLQVNESSMTHAMVITAVHVDPASGQPVRYRVENSWGPDVGDKGYFVMTDKWFEEFVFQVVVPKTLAPKELVKVYESGEKTVLPPWDPMGSLA